MHTLPFFTLLLVFGLFFAACQGDSRQSYGDATGLHVSEADHLFFKNTRLRYYRAQEDEASKMTYYFHEKLAADTFPLQLYLVDNWIHSKAFLALKNKGEAAPQDLKEAVGIQLIAYQQNSNQLVFTSDELGDIPALFRFRAALERGDRICFNQSSSGLQSCLPITATFRRAWGETIADFLNLTQLEQRKQRGS